MNCLYCDSPLPPGAVECPNCGAPAPAESSVPPPQPQMPQFASAPQPTRKKSPLLAELLSFPVIGLGQMYNGQVIKGALLLLVTVILVFAIHPMVFWIFWLLAVLDAGRIAGKINAGETVTPWTFF